MKKAKETQLRGPNKSNRDRGFHHPVVEPENLNSVGIIYINM